jgi:hypothetical protein
MEQNFQTIREKYVQQNTKDKDDEEFKQFIVCVLKFLGLDEKKCQFLTLQNHSKTKT